MAARIFQEPKSTMQSGKARAGTWVLEFEPSERRHADPLMGWTGSGDTQAQVRLRFETLDAAKAYADREAITYHVVPAATPKLKLQAYADNFK
jgi:hypothetical protein